MTDLTKENEITEVDFSFDGAHLALTHKSQGFSANGKPKALLIKADDVELTDEAKKIADLIKDVNAEVSITTDMVTFLTKWLGMYWSDAKALARLMGYESGKDEVTESDWIGEKIEGITLLKSAEVPAVAKYSEIVKLKKFIDSNESLKNSLSEGNSEVKNEMNKSHKPSEKKKVKGAMSMSDKDQMTLEKAQAQLADMEAKIAEIQKAADLEKTAMNSRIEAFEKAENERIEKVFTKKVETYSFVGEDQRADVVKMLREINSVDLVQLLDKAQTAIDAIKVPQGSDQSDSVVEKESGLAALLKAQFPEV